MSASQPRQTPPALIALIALTPALPACSNRMLYQTVQGWQQQDCRKIGDAAERQRCLNSTAASYDDYRRAREAAQGPK